MERVENFDYKLKIVPENSGCYLYYNKNHEIIYVGKAKNLHRRVNSYFNRANNLKTTLLVSEIYDFEYIITNSERESLLLEINLIKKHLPYYNIKLTDDSTYPYIELTSEAHPRLLISRKPSKKSLVFGPYPDSFSAKQVLNLLNQIYPLRKCKNIPDTKCVYYEMGRCLGPCINNVKLEEYQSITKEIKKFLKGDTKDIVNSLKQKMLEASENLEFEKAKEYRDLIENIKSVAEKQTINDNTFVDRDCLTYAVSEEKICIALFMVRGGKLVSRDLKVYDLNDEASSIFSQFVTQYYFNYNILLASEIVLSEEVEGLNELVNSKIIIPKIGDKMRILELAYENAKNKLVEDELLRKRKEDVTIKANNELRDLLGLSSLHTIEMFDNSNTNGLDSVSAMVRYKDGVKDKQNYRKFKVKTVKGADDYATMKEVVYRRYFRLMMEGSDLPDLLIMDGGKGQVSAAKEIIDSLNLNLKIIGLVKDDKHKTRGIIDDNFKEIEIKRNSNLYSFLEGIQEEVHRYAITYHRDTREKNYKKSVLDSIKGIGEKRKMLLLKNFDSIDALKEASLEDIVKLGIPLKTAREIKKELEGLK